MMRSEPGQTGDETLQNARHSRSASAAFALISAHDRSIIGPNSETRETRMEASALFSTPRASFRAPQAQVSTHAPLSGRHTDWHRAE